MSDQWAKSVSYRVALDDLSARFAELALQDRIARSELMPNIESIDGYLFAINSVPAKVSPAEWLGDLLPLIQLADEAPAAAVNLLISYQVHSLARMAQQQYAVPLETDPLAALKPASALNSFSHGFEVGYRRIATVWSASIPEELRSELTSQVFALTFFASTENARLYLSARKSPMRPDQLAEQVLKNLPKAADLHVRLGMALALERGTAH
ncbi:UPF0149 family protein [Reinekea sp.]|jgi:uncharacterized protein YecA (UPF0149 family)|uniref:UPF0149 family protein n=1 Tax=Reinekea sp. TaxID=1970455 RepID=UPI002A80238E|nr:UPF0149 family protein [Reinekea sp.]